MAELSFPLINGPQNQELRKQLWLKLGEYDNRLLGNYKSAIEEIENPWKYMLPVRAYIAYPDYRDAFYKAYVLWMVLKNKGPVNSLVLREDLVKTMTRVAFFDGEKFDMACLVVDKYTKGKNFVGGTGLPMLLNGSDIAEEQQVMQITEVVKSFGLRIPTGE
jgi:hypothetical protein